MTDKLSVEEIARRLMILLEKNVCICDCLGCKTSSCLDCSASDSPPWKRWDMCFEQDDDSQRNIEQALLSFAAQEVEPLVMAVKFYANKEQYTNMGFNGEPTPIYHDRGAVAKEALTAWEGKK